MWSWETRISIDDSKDYIPRMNSLIEKTTDPRRLEMLHSFKEQAEYRRLSAKQIDFIVKVEVEQLEREKRLQAPIWNDNFWDDEVGKICKSAIDF